MTQASTAQQTAPWMVGSGIVPARTRAPFWPCPFRWSENRLSPSLRRTSRAQALRARATRLQTCWSVEFLGLAGCALQSFVVSDILLGIMTEQARRQHRKQSFGEEIANSVSHGIGFIAAVIALPFLLGAAIGHRRSSVLIGALVFAFTVLLLYSISTIYHALPQCSAKRVLQILDHGAIFLLIAGTYTPITLGVLSGPWGWTLLTLVWSLALVGILLKVISGIRHPKLSMTLYIVMGWLALIAVRPLWLHMPGPGILWLAAGGVVYSGGVAFFALERVRYAHFVWHLCVLAGTACHFVAVMNYSV